MKNFPILLLLLSGLPFVSAQAQPAAPPQEPAPAQNPAPPAVPNPLSTTTKDGVTITPIDVETTDTDAMLNITYWRFQVQKPEAAPLDWRLELREANKEPVLMADGHTSYSKEEELTFGMMPDEGQSVYSSPMIKIYLRPRYMERGVKTTGGLTLPERRKNPAFGLKISSITSSFLDRARTDGTIRLMDFGAGQKEAPVKGEKVLVLAPSKYLRPLK